jgi:fructokinase
VIKALTFGEILWDIIEGKPYIGGAPFNLAAHLSKMGCDVAMISALGDDDLGLRAFERAESFNIDTRYIVNIPDVPTGTVDVFLDSKGLPDYTIHEHTAWDQLTISPSGFKGLASEQRDVICFGTLAQRTAGNRKLLLSILSQASSKHVFYDVNLRQQYFQSDWITESLKYSSIVKLNDEEAEVISKLLYRESVSSLKDEERFAESIAADFGLRTVLITRGKEGALVYCNGVSAEVTCGDVSIVDTVGAGDSFSAGFLRAYLSGRSALESARFASTVADFVVGMRGAIPDYSPELLKKISSLGS